MIVNRVVNLSKIAFGQETSPRFNGVPIEWPTPYYLPFQLRFRFPKLAVWAIAVWIALLASLPFIVFGALWSETLAGSIWAPRGSPTGG